MRKHLASNAFLPGNDFKETYLKELST